MTARIAILADDLTGAADTGAPFAAAGWPTVVLLSPDAPAPLPPADVLVLTSESRALPPDAAAAATRRCATRIGAWCQGDASVRVYKKIDSTLRGHPAMELEVLMDTLGERAALVAPAFPAQGRTTVSGRQYVNGVPIERTAFGQDGSTSDLGALFTRSAPGAVAVLSRGDLQRGVEHLVGRLVQERGIRLWMADAEDDADLALLAAAALASPLRVLCGSAGLARALAVSSRWAPGPGAVRRNVPEGRSPAGEGRGPVLVVAGSRHAATAAQVDVLRRQGVVLVRPEVSFLVLTGGDTASAVCHGLGSLSLWLTGELQPGMATATLVGGRHPDIPIVAKAGGFGDEAALRHAVASLRGPGP